MATLQDPAMTPRQTQSLRKLIGRQARYHGVKYEVIEVLEEEPALVLEDCEDHKTIQADQHGEAHRRVPQTITLRIPFLPDGEADLEAVGLEIISIKADPPDNPPYEGVRD